MFIAFLLSCATAVVVLTCRYFKNRRFNVFVNKLPSPPGAPILGHLSKFKKLDGLMEMITNYLEEYDGMVLFRPGPTIKYFAVADHKLVEYLCTSKKVIKSKRYQLFVKWLGYGLFTAEFEEWRKHRHRIQPAFHFQVLEQFVHTFNSVSHIFVKLLSTEINKPIDIYESVNLCALDIISETAMGVPLNAQTNSFSKYVHALHDMLRIIAVRSFSPLKVHDWIYRMTKDFHREEEALRILKGYTNSVIEKKQNALNQNGVRASDPEKKRRLAFLDLLLEKRHELTEEEMSMAVEGFMFAGHDTTAIAMAAAFYELSKHPDIQQRAFDELKEIFGNDTERGASYKDLQDMKYVEMIIKEALRLYPPAPIISKQLLEDYEFNGYTLPKGLNALVMIHSIHRREKYFPDPHKFDPERFSAKNMENIKPFSYIPFSGGPRNCVGQKFAMLEMKVVVSRLLRSFEIVSVDDYKIKLIPQIVQKPEKGIYVKLVPRKY